MTLADRVVVLRDGVIEQVGTPLELYDRPANRFVAQFIGMPQMNILSTKGLDAPEGTIEMGVRTEHMTICNTDDGRIKGVVEIVDSLGNETLIHVRPEQADKHDPALIVRQYERTELQVGDQVGVLWSDDHAHYFDAQGQVLRLSRQRAAA